MCRSKPQRYGSDRFFFRGGFSPVSYDPQRGANPPTMFSNTQLCIHPVFTQSRRTLSDCSQYAHCMFSGWTCIRAARLKREPCKGRRKPPIPNCSSNALQRARQHSGSGSKNKSGAQANQYKNLLATRRRN